MDKQTKLLLLFGTGLTTGMYALTAPVTQIYFMQRISPQFLAFVNTLSLATAVGITTLFTKESVRRWLHKWFVWIVILDVIGLAVFNFVGVEHVKVRFVGITSLSNISAALWIMLLQDRINHQISGDELTTWNATYRSIILWTGVIGAVGGMVFSDMSIEWCLGLQCVVTLIMGVCDVKAYRKLDITNKHDDTSEVELCSNV